MSRREKQRLSKKKWALIGGLLLLVVAAPILFLTGGFGQGQQAAQAEPYLLAPVTEGSIASSTLLSGTVKTLREQKVYYDTSKGDIAEVYVKPGDQVVAGQRLFQYSTVNAQANYDQAVRALNKVGRQIHDLKTTGVVTTTDEEGNSTDNSRSYQSQLNDLYDAYADAEQGVNKAKEVLDQTLELSTIEGTVVEVNTTVDPSKTGGQLVVHIVSEGQLQVEGSLTEYDMGHIAVNQEVRLTSKVYPEMTWDGRISYISNYPSETVSSGGGSSSSAASYPFKVDFAGDTSALKQGFKMTIEVVNKEVHRLVPVAAVVPEGDKHYVWVYDKDKQLVSRVEVTLGRADAINQEITSGLEVNQLVLSNPTSDLVDGQALSAEQVIEAGQEEANG